MTFPNLIYWPAGVRMSVLRDSYQSLPPNQYLRSEMERGAKQRKVSSGLPDLLSCRFRFPIAEYNLFKTFIETDLPNSGSLRFYWKHPETGEPSIGQVYVEEGRSHLPSPAPGYNRFVNMKIENWVLPSDFVYEGPST